MHHHPRSSGRLGSARGRRAALPWAGVCAVLGACSGVGTATVQVDRETRFQTIIGWEGTIAVGDGEMPEDSIARYRDALYDFLVDSVGLNALRLETRSGIESPVDHFAEVRQDLSRVREYLAARYASVNDNEDPFVIDTAGFQFTWIDQLVKSAVLPMKRRLAERGQQLYLTLTVVDFGTSEYEQLADPEEYAEFALAHFLHFEEAFGFVPDALEVVLEPDAGQIWDAESIARAVIAAGDRLAANEFRPAFVVPSTSNMWSAAEYVERIATYPRAMEYVTDLAYHRYRGVSVDAVRRIAALGTEHGVRTAMLEHIRGDYHELHEDLAVGQVSRWQQYALGLPLAVDDGTVYALVTEATPERTSIEAASRTPMLSQYFRAIRPGAVRVAASSDNAGVDPLAFVNEDGSVTVVLKTLGRARIRVVGLPAGRTEAEYMTERANTRIPLGEVERDGSGVTVGIPGAGVITLRSAGS